MKLTTVKEIYKEREKYLDQEVTVGGWVRSVRDTQFNNNQIELSVKTREVESIRQVIKQEKEQHKKEMQRIQKEAKENKEKALEEFDAKKKDLEGNI